MLEWAIRHETIHKDRPYYQPVNSEELADVIVARVGGEKVHRIVGEWQEGTHHHSWFPTGVEGGIMCPYCMDRSDPERVGLDIVHGPVTEQDTAEGADPGVPLPIRQVPGEPHE